MFIDRFAVASLQLESSVATTVRLQGIETNAWKEMSSYSLIGGRGVSGQAQDRPPATNCEVAHNRKLLSLSNA